MARSAKAGRLRAERVVANRRAALAERRAQRAEGKLAAASDLCDQKLCALWDKMPTDVAMQCPPGRVAAILALIPLVELVVGVTDQRYSWETRCECQACAIWRGNLRRLRRMLAALRGRKP